MLAKHISQLSALLYRPVKTFQLKGKDSIWNE